ncbi:MAG: pyrroline-5-carboxylate reductase [Sphingomonadaceae bacterium]|nr:pyrroline-5-carboxylate reductase [Sphingomonadaceae bacterium]MDW8415095.1 pyrroline-5-carboxylate reductase [Thermaurantiacus sp.]
MNTPVPLPLRSAGALWLLGCGQMGGALLERWLGVGLPAAAVVAIDPAPRAAPARTTPRADLPARGPDPAVVVLAVKPQNLADVAPPLAARLAARRPLLVSMLAGVRLPTLSGLFPGWPLARIMPNLPARVGRGITAVLAPGLSPAERALLDWLLGTTGAVVELQDETRFDAVTAVSGSGPAFLCRFIEALAGAGEAAGLDAAISRALARETVLGTAALLTAEGLDPATLRQRVTSPGGTTEAGLDALDGDGALSALLRATVRAATERARQLAHDAAARSPQDTTRIHA